MATGAERLVLHVYDVLNRGLTHEEVASELEPVLHPEVEYVSPPDALEPGVRRGIAGWRTVLGAIADGLGPAATFHVRETHERGDRVLSAVCIRTGGGASGVEVAGPTVGAIWTLRDGMVRRLEWYWDVEQARAIFERD